MLYPVRSSCYHCCFLAALLAESNNAACSDRRSRSVVRLYVCMFVTLVHPAKAIGRNEVPFGRDTHVVPSNIILDGGPSPPQKGEILGIRLGIEIPSQNLHC